MREKANSAGKEAGERAFTRGMAGMTAAGLITKVLGYARDAMLVAFFGGGALADAYYAAFRLVNVFRRTVGEGALNAVFIPMFEREKARHPEAAGRFFASAWTVIFLFSILLASAGILFRRELVAVTAWGFRASPFQLELTAALTAVLMPHLLFVNVAAFFTAALNSARRFFLPALAPAFFSLSVIALLLAFNAGFLYRLDGVSRIMALAAVASASGLLQALALLPLLRREGYALSFSNPLNGLASAPALAAAVPAALTLAQDQVSMLINTFFASFLPAGSITAIYNSARLVQFPVSLFAATAAAVALPELSARSAAGDRDGFRVHLRHATASSWLIMLPAAAGITVMALPVCRALFEHGRFSPEQSAVTASALFWLALGLPAFGFNKVAAASLYALRRQTEPLAIITAQLLLNAALCLPLMGRLGTGGLMLATSLSSWGAALAFALALRARSGENPLAGLPVFRPALAAAAAAGAAFFFRENLHSPLAATAAGVPAAVLVYFAGLRLLKVEERSLVTGGRF